MFPMSMGRLTAAGEGEQNNAIELIEPRCGGRNQAGPPSHRRHRYFLFGGPQTTESSGRWRCGIPLVAQRHYILPHRAARVNSCRNAECANLRTLQCNVLIKNNVTYMCISSRTRNQPELVM